MLQSSVLGALLKSLIPDRPLPICSGPLRGVRFNPHTARLQCWLGTYEAAVQQAAVRLLRPGDTVYDVGAFVGFFTLLAARLVGPTGHVLALEPHPDNRARLRAHLDANPTLRSQVEVHPVAAGAAPGRAALLGSGETGHLTPGLDLPVTTLDALGSTPALVKIDVEGHEGDVLTGAAQLLARRQTAWLLEVHGTPPSAPTFPSGYTIEWLSLRHLLATPSA